MGLDTALSDCGILPLIVTYQTEGPRVDHARREAARVGFKPRIALSICSNDARGTALYEPGLNARKRRRSMTPGEIACYWGHREAWRLLLQMGAAYALVLEDDFHVKDPDVLERALAALPKMPAFDILLFRMHKPRGAVRRRLFDGFVVEDRLFGATGATGYLISAEGARKLLARPRIFRPVDEDFIAPWELGLRVFNLNPEPIGETDTLISSLEDQRINHPRQRKRRLRGVWFKVHWQILSLVHWLMRARG